MSEVYGYKVFNSDWTCRDFQYEVGKTYKENSKPKCCKRGFHFCKNICDCFYYYDFNSEKKVARVVALGEIDSEEYKCCTNEIKILEEIPWEEVYIMVNTGVANAGMNNTGDNNSGFLNSGYCNSGDCNTGRYNLGDYNVGNYNIGSKNIGDYNIGNLNTGDFNYGKFNSGGWNQGNMNTGDWNIGNRSNGCFNTVEEPTIYFFNKPSSWTYGMWRTSLAYCILAKMPMTHIGWVNDYVMTEQEKIDNPDYKFTGGFLMKINHTTKDRQEWWDKLDFPRKYEVISLPNFDPDIFEEITGIKVDVQAVLDEKKKFRGERLTKFDLLYSAK